MYENLNGFFSLLIYFIVVYDFSQHSLNIVTISDSVNSLAMLFMGLS